jgi:hypothetical protein
VRRQRRPLLRSEDSEDGDWDTNSRRADNFRAISGGYHGVVEPACQHERQKGSHPGTFLWLTASRPCAKPVRVGIYQRRGNGQGLDSWMRQLARLMVRFARLGELARSWSVKGTSPPGIANFETQLARRFERSFSSSTVAREIIDLSPARPSSLYNVRTECVCGKVLFFAGFL